MKKYLFFAAALLTLAACSNDENTPDDSRTAIRLSSGIEVLSRATTDIQSSAFDEGEKIAVLINEATKAGQTATTTYPQPLAYTIGASGVMNLDDANNQPYFPTSGNGVNIYAVYPQNAYSNTTFTVQKDQSTDVNYKASDLMYGMANNPVARTKDAVAVTFKHLLSKVTIKLKAGDGLTESDLANAKVELLSIKPQVSFDAASGTIGEANGTETDVIVFKDNALNLNGSAIIAPQTLKEQFIRVTLADGGVLAGGVTGGSQQVLNGGSEYTYNITVNLTSLSMTANITPWTGSGTDINGNANMQ